jgi:hypothetical protein
MKDANSKKLCEYIIQNGVGPAFKYANIDDPNVFRNRPQQIKSIPTIFIQETGQIYSGKNAFEFVKTIIIQKVQMQQMREQQQQQQRPQMMQSQEMFEAPPRQMPQSRQPQEMRQMSAQEMMQDGRNGGLPPVNANQIQSAIQNKKDNGIGDLFQKEGITPFVGAEMCDGDQCYGFLENDSSITGTYTFIGSDGNFVNSASATKQGQQRPQRQQREEFVPPGLRSAETKGNKSGMDMDRAFEQFTANRNSEFMPVRRF